VRIGSPQAAEVGKFLERRGVKWSDEETGEKVIAKLVEMAPFCANWKFITRFARKAKQAKGGVDLEQAVEFITAIEKARKGS
jgi:hypothetical protein